MNASENPERPKILQMNGLSVSDFDSTEQALATADELIEFSAGEFGFTKETLEHENTLLSRHFYMVSKGKQRKITNGQEKQIGGETDLNKDGKAGASLLALRDGEMSAFDKTGAASVKMEFPHLTAVQTEAEILRSVCTHTHTRTHNTHPTSPLEETQT